MVINKMDFYFKSITNRILKDGTKDINPRPKYEDGTPAHTISINHEMMTFNLANGEFPLLTLRPVPIKSSIGELLWIYRDESNNLDLLKDKYNITWWDSWDIGDRTIGSCYGYTVKKHNLMKNLLKSLRENPDGRRHIINLWQEDDFKSKHGLKPCCYQTVWNVRHEKDNDYLDMTMFQRSCDWLVAASASNQIQYASFLSIIATYLGYIPGRYTWFGANVQIYDRHIDAAKEMLNRESIRQLNPIYVVSNKPNIDFYELMPNDLDITGIDLDDIKKQNPQIKFELGI